MFTPDEMDALCNNEIYRSTRKFLYNRKFARNVIRYGCGGISLSVAANGDITGMIDFIRLFWGIAKYWLIAKEIGWFRNRIIENAYSKCTRKCPIWELVTSEYLWVEDNVEKIIQMKNITTVFLTDPKIVKLFCDSTNAANKEERFVEISEKISERFDEYIDRLKAYAMRKLSDSSFSCSIEDIRAALKKGTSGGITDDH